MEHPAQQYYNPNLTGAEERALLRRNYLVLQTGQAALGLIGPDMLGIAVEAQPDAVVLHFAIAIRTAETEEDISLAHVGQPDDTWPGGPHALLYLAKFQGG
ncbi:hypothetical protein KZZ52_11960 [Dactylosporangium sp. AC04546]|uniref:hypothetical protein n=1 Tax=Dactylosporangium sp. AC04546 TaxID=2862460 RepID=UPI001EE071C7|nr:hypothetical protein [Dactylosporangium sp. AC04546]WVK86059.1 hypothetical protein KZZ52_11960 [Dactylosporangium sp. AC04546]